MASDYVKNEIRTNYANEDLDSLSKRLNIKKDTVRKIANRMGLTRRKIVSNAIVDGFKKCCVCGKMLPLSHFTTDPGAPNGYDYRCKKCKYAKKETCPEACQDDKNKRPKVCQKHHDMAFGISKKHNPVIMVIDSNGNHVLGKRCKSCGNSKPLSDFNFADKRKGTRKNICRQCIKDKYKGII